MIITAFLNIIWILWSLYILIIGFGQYQSAHAHTYAWLFSAGVLSLLAGSSFMKIVMIRKQVTRWVRLGFGLWVLGFLLLGASILAGTNLPAAHILKEHVLFDHKNFLVFLMGVILSVYLDTRLVSRYGLSFQNGTEQ